MKRIGLILVAATLALPLARLAAAAPTPEMMELGKKEYEEGSREFNLGHYEKALEHFESSYRLTGKPGLLFNIGYVHEWLYRRNRKLEHLEQAIERFKFHLISTANELDPAVLQQRGRTTTELKRCEDELAKERASRARGEGALQVGEDAMDKGHVLEAIAQVDKFERSAGNERAGMVRAFVLRARIAVANRDVPGAANWLERALSLDKGVVLPPKADEKLQRAFAEAQRRIGAQPVVTVTHTPPGGLIPGAPVELYFNIASDPAYLVSGFQLYYRVAGGRAYSKIPIGAVGRIALPRVFASQLQPGMKIEYYADVLDRNGAFIEHLGTEAVPFTAMVGKPPSKPVAKRASFWVPLVVGVLAGAGVGVGLGLYYTQPPTPPPSIPINVGQALAHW